MHIKTKSIIYIAKTVLLKTNVISIVKKINFLDTNILVF
jgi:hypothetical protein